MPKLCLGGGVAVEESQVAVEKRTFEVCLK